MPWAAERDPRLRRLWRECAYGACDTTCLPRGSAAFDPVNAAITAPPRGAEVPVRVIEPRRPVPLRELWGARDLLYFLTWRDVRVRYTQSLLGLGWAVAQPLLMMGLIAVVLGVLAKVPAPSGVEYPLFVLAGLVPWTFFANGVSSASESLVGSAHLVGKVYFPRLVIPLAALLAWTPDLGVALGLLAVAMAVFGVAPGWAVVAAPAFIFLAVLTAVSVGVWLSAVNVAYRDVKYVVPFALQLGMFATPVIYSAELVPEGARTVYGLNPMVGVVEGLRWSLLGQAAPDWTMVAASVAAVVVVLATGLRYFRRVERYFADVI